MLTEPPVTSNFFMLCSRRRRSLDGPLLVPGHSDNFKDYDMYGNVSHARIYGHDCNHTDRFATESHYEQPGYMTRSRRMLQEHRRGQHVLARQRRFGGSIPRFRCR